MADIRTIRTVFAAVNADVIGTVSAIIAVAAHYVGAVNTHTAIGTEFVHASGALAATFADIFGAVSANSAAVLAYLSATAALIAVLAEQTINAFTADIAGSAEFVKAVGTFFTTIRTEICAVFASLTAGTDDAAVRAESAGHTEAVRSGAVNAFAAFRTHFSVSAV